MAIKLLFVGLGNYTHPNTRHNVGMMVLDAMAKELNLVWSQHKPWKSMVAQTTLSLIAKDASITQVQLTLLKPRLLMNVSGTSVAKAVNELAIQPSSQLFVFHDDLQRPLGKISLKNTGSANGHNGIKSVIEKLGSNDFARVRIGIGRPESRDPDDVADFVLGKFTDQEIDGLDKTVYPLLVQEDPLTCLCLRRELWRPPKPPKEKKLRAPTPPPVPPVESC
ncbi:peptidyl-tRNA hydrolase [Hesseltinella vesiculosa]|uniref:Peptidyl-tRNA hydrolase n=1 Tax=Hesseltinella vesiculosa TaxID=101127 RepID=A0A1X2GT30_9FUNG|nr:peptidyl-tRNA hydrolase [Hesseltinella vesiculosa]